MSLLGKPLGSVVQVCTNSRKIYLMGSENMYIWHRQLIQLIYLNYYTIIFTPEKAEGSVIHRLNNQQCSTCSQFQTLRTLPAIKMWVSMEVERSVAGQCASTIPGLSSC